MSAHTPGPWFWSQGVDDWELVGADANRVLFCWNDKTKWKSGLIVGENIKEADARLIAAAPDMYEALALFVQYDETPNGDGVLMMMRYADVIAAARAALAKARGQ